MNLSSLVEANRLAVLQDGAGTSALVSFQPDGPCVLATVHGHAFLNSARGIPGVVFTPAAIQRKLGMRWTFDDLAKASAPRAAQIQSWGATGVAEGFRGFLGAR